MIIVDQSPNAIPQMHDVEVNEKADCFVTEFQVRQQLRLVNMQNLLDNFQLYNDFVFYEQIDLVTALDFHTVVDYRDPHLRFDSQTSLRQFMFEALLVDAFEHPWPESSVDSHSRIDNSPRDAIEFHICLEKDL